MSLDIWFKSDLRNVLVGLHQSIMQTGVDGEFRRGYEAALISFALALGIEVTLLEVERRSLTEGSETPHS